MFPFHRKQTYKRHIPGVFFLASDSEQARMEIKKKKFKGHILYWGNLVITSTAPEYLRVKTLWGAE